MRGIFVGRFSFLLALAGSTVIPVGSGAAWATPFGWMDSGVDTRDGDHTVPIFGEIRAQGWAADDSGPNPIYDVRMFLGTSSALGDEAAWNSTMGLARPDVASYFGNPAYGNSGWENTFLVGVQGQSVPFGLNWLKAMPSTGGGTLPLLSGSIQINVVPNDTYDVVGYIRRGVTDGPEWQYAVSGDTSTYVNNYQSNLIPGSYWSMCAQAPGRDAVWKFQLTATELMEFSTEGSSYDTVLYVVREDNTGMGCNDDHYDSFGHWVTTSKVSVTLAPGTYYVFLDGYYANGGGPFNLVVSYL